MPLLKNAAEDHDSDVRIVDVSRIWGLRYGALHQKISSLTDLDVSKGAGMPSGLKRYGLSKLCNIWFTVELQKRLAVENVNIRVLACHPGGALTPGSQGFVNGFPSFLRPLIGPLVRLIFTSGEVRAYSTMFAATSTKARAEEYKGVTSEPPNKIMKLSGKKNLAVQLWMLSEKVVKQVLEEGRVRE